MDFARSRSLRVARLWISLDLTRSRRDLGQLASFPRLTSSTHFHV
ncbi:hypothetical protein LEMLEM_LOCUS16335, partial [Lemmus lemmus]